MRRLIPLLLLAAGLLLAAPASARTVWLCKPGLANNPCLESLTTTVLEGDGSTRVQRTRLAHRPEVDCFYVYPTVTGQSGTNATKAKDPEILAVARAQASRFSSLCRVYAPVYRQLTITGIADPVAVAGKPGARAYGDVRSAWREYLRRHNDGRGVVLIGHSQGTFILRRLARLEIDRRPAVRRRLVSALLLGGDVDVRKGSDRGGDFRRIRACRRAGQIGCVIAYSAYAEAPPADTVFGRPRPRFFDSARASARLEVLCTNPAALSGDGGRLRAYFPTERIPGPIGLVQDPPPSGISTYWAATPGLYRARCASGGGANWLQVDDVGGSGDQRQRVTQSLGPAWGLHLVDMNLAFGNLVEVVRRQAAAYLRRRG
jgi:pimeloyl-ACP methyl ester carboxylesterase